MTTSDRFRPATDAFLALVDDGTERGGAFAVMQNGQVIAEAWGGTESAAGTPWDHSTRVQVFSAGKPFVALAALLAVKEGPLTLDDPIRTWWPDYRDDASSPTTLRMILCHTSGKHAFPATNQVSLFDSTGLIRLIADSAPATTPGALLVEHAATYGHLVDGVLAAVGAPSVAERAVELNTALGVRLHFGIPPQEQDGIATLEAAAPGWEARYLETEVARAALLHPPGLLDLSVLASETWRAASFPAVGLITDALSLATFYDDVHRDDGVVAALLGDELHRALLRPSAVGFDEFVRSDVEWSLGLRVEGGELGMGGIGGSSAWYSRRFDYAMAYVTRGLIDHARADRVADVVEACLASDD
ncbi:beta-lactamase family protein [Herbiconiux moechotypicola]|uniref:Beta-lactamase-related domain-containing protein n=1 Tax=Herbiconiux moechotypicola TaxID=637393 RepID=A0ABN3E976_9MICO|nr:serine hydrolase domain-containing protein [Herbiconiux moechotypicola]MCS5732097.1 beta-lactamase family protein [Herbiconiux moechotypicola]